MAKNVLRSELSLENRRAKQAAKDATKEVEKFGKKGKQATTEVDDKTKELAQDLDGITGQLGFNATAFLNWKTGAVAAVGLVAAGVSKLIANIKELDRKLSATYEQYVDFAEDPRTRAMAKLRGTTPEREALWAKRKGAEFLLPAATVRDVAYEIESALPRMDPLERMRVIEDAYRAARVTGAGADIAGLVSAAKQSGLAKSAQDYRQFLALAAKTAEASKANLQQFGSILAKKLPLAVKAGIDPYYFASFAAAMSFRYTPETIGELETDIDRLIRGAGRVGSAGLPAGVTTATQIIEYQAREISKAYTTGGPQAGLRRAEALGLEPRMATMIGGRLGPEIFAERELLEPELRGVRAGDVAKILREWEATRAGRFVRARAEKEQAEIERAAAGAEFEAVRKSVEADYEQLLGDPSIMGDIARQAEVSVGPAGGLLGAGRRARIAMEMTRDMPLWRRLFDPVQAARWGAYIFAGARPGNTMNVNTINVPPPQDRTALPSKSEAAGRGVE